MYIKKFLKRIFFLIQLVMVVVFIVFEEIIWEGIAKPVYDYVYEMRLLQVLQKQLESVNRYVIMIIFMILLAGVEGAGLAAGIMAVRGMIISAALLYGLKIPIAAFTFWLFHISEKKLLSFYWFRWGYELIMTLFRWIKEREIYSDTVEIFKGFKKNLQQLKRRYLDEENSIVKRFKKLYNTLKNILKKSK